MGSITLRVRSLAWFVTGAVLATAVTLMFVDAWRVDAAPGDDDSTFVPITPCRLADTRSAPNRVGPSGTLSASDTTVFQATGSNGECTLPDDAVSLSLNITALGATAQTFLTVWGDGDQPLAASLNPAPGQPPIPNAVTTPLSGAGAINIYNDTGTVDVVIDVVGYYTQASLHQLAQRLAAVEAGTATNAAGITALDAAQPFAVSARDDEVYVGSSDEVVVFVDVAAPVAGQVSINSSLTAFQSTAADGVGCSITTGNAFNTDYLQVWESGGTNDFDYAVLSGTRVFDVTAGVDTYNLVCKHFSNVGSTLIFNSVLTAIFTPAP